MSAERMVLALAGLGAAYLLVKQREDDARQAYDAWYASQQAQANQGGGPDLGDTLKAGLLDFGLGFLSDRLSQSVSWPQGGGQASGGGLDLSEFLNVSTTNFQAGPDDGSRDRRVDDILAVIKDAESNGDYNIVFHGSRIRPPKPITQMTVAEVLDWQDASVAAGSASSAVGAYQIIRKTMRSLISDGTIRRTDRFNRTTQDRAAMGLLRRRGLDSYLAGSLSAEAFGNNLAKEWAGLPVITGPKRGGSYYGGDGLNSATVTLAQMESALGIRSA